MTGNRQFQDGAEVPERKGSPRRFGCSHREGPGGKGSGHIGLLLRQGDSNTTPLAFTGDRIGIDRAETLAGNRSGKVGAGFSFPGNEAEEGWLLRIIRIHPDLVLRCPLDLGDPAGSGAEGGPCPSIRLSNSLNNNSLTFRQILRQDFLHTGGEDRGDDRHQ